MKFFSRSAFGLSVIALFALATSTFANEAELSPETVLPEVQLKEEDQPAGQTLVGVLTFQQFLTQVRANHPKLYSADLDRRIAGAKLLEKQGAFDPGISLETDYLRYNDFSNRGKVSKALDNDLSLGWLTRSGARIATGGRYNTGDVKPPLYPTGSTGEYFLSARMPLLRGFRINEKVAMEMQAEIGIPLADAMFNQSRLSTLLQASYGYWNWVYAHRKVGVSDNLLALATVRYQAIQERVKAGDLPPIDEVEAGQEVQRRAGLLVRSQREYERQLFNLSRYLWEPGGQPAALPEKRAIPEMLPTPDALEEADWMEARKLALETRPELKALNLQKEMVEVDLRQAKNLKLPVLDLFATPGYDTGNESIGPTIKAGVVLTVPLRQRTANGMIAAAEFRTQKLDLEQRLVLQQILLEVDDSVSAINAAYKQYLAANKEYEFAKELEKGERQRFEFGDSTLFLVNQRERSSAEAAMRLLDLEVEYHQTIANFKAVSGQL
ncbi:TolC family protein [Vampirovibrio sp.]|uniref:TolC family protein n=1 Tax=Vampirovibrio sp. TaxID=2717857 RepID=UPI00359359B6